MHHHIDRNLINTDSFEAVICLFARILSYAPNMHVRFCVCLERALLFFFLRLRELLPSLAVARGCGAALESAALRWGR